MLSLLPRLGIIQHPLDPIGTSPSNTIRAFYAAILLLTLILKRGEATDKSVTSEYLCLSPGRNAGAVARN